MTELTVKDLLEAKGKRQLAYVQVAREEEAIAASEVGLDMIYYCGQRSCQTNQNSHRIASTA